LNRRFKRDDFFVGGMDSEGLFTVDPDDIPLLIATGMIAVGCILVILNIGAGHPLVPVLVTGGTVAFVALTLFRIPERNITVGAASISMILGSALVSIELPFAFDFDGPVGAALFLFGAIGIAGYMDD
jgi:hypothetical protein